MIDNGEESKNEEEELSAAAKALLQGDDEMQIVHSQKSVAAMLRAARDKVVVKGKGTDGIVLKSNASNEVQ